MYECGLCISEVVKLRVGDFDKKNFTISIRKSKGNVSRVVYYGHSLRDTLNKYALAIGLHGDHLISSYIVTRPTVDRWEDRCNGIPSAKRFLPLDVTSGHLLRYRADQSVLYMVAETHAPPPRALHCP